MTSSIPLESSTIDSLSKRLIDALFTGDRPRARAVISDALHAGIAPPEIIRLLVWPILEKIQSLFHADRINTGVHHMAARLLRMLFDQLSLRLPHRPRNGRVLLVICSPGEPEELGVEITADMAEAHGWTVHFAGGGVPNDEIVGWIGKLLPHVLMVFGTIPSGVPMVRELIDQLHNVGIAPTMQIICSGGVFNRARELADLIGSDLMAADPMSALALLDAYSSLRATRGPQAINRKRPGKRAKSAA